MSALQVERDLELEVHCAVLMGWLHLRAPDENRLNWIGCPPDVPHRALLPAPDVDSQNERAYQVDGEAFFMHPTGGIFLPPWTNRLEHALGHYGPAEHMRREGYRWTHRELDDVVQWVVYLPGDKAVSSTGSAPLGHDALAITRAAVAALKAGAER